MKIHNLSELPAEMSHQVDGLIDQLATVTEAIRIAEDERKRLRDELVEVLSVVGVQPGDMLEAPDRGVRVEMMQRTQRNLHRDTLMKLGVSKQILDAATTEALTTPYVVIRQISSDGD